MIEKFLIITKGGVILFEWESLGCQLPNAIIDKLIHDVIIDEKSGISSFNQDSYEGKWRLDNNNDLIFIVFTLKQFGVTYLDALLELIEKQFSTIFVEEQKSVISDYQKRFSEIFSQSVKKVETKKTVTKMSTYEESSKSKKTLVAQSEQKKEKEGGASKTKKTDLKTSKKDLLKKSGGAGKKVKSPPTTKNWTKEKRTWNDGPAKGEEAKKLNFGDEASASDSTAPVSESELQFDLNLPPNGEAFDEEEEEEEEETQDNKPKKRSFFSSLFSPLTGKNLEFEDLDPVLKKLKDHIIQKNVASQIAEQLCESVLNSLKGKHLGSFKTVSATVNEALREALTKILTPKKPINILRDIKECQSKRVPYVMVFCGINGVGKSTTLAKVCAWLKSQQLKVMIVGCDTFRAGAIEQLRTHAERLAVPLFHQGYGCDPANVARQAISHATESSSHADVVLVDTAGRMQGNVEQMAALAKLVHLNNPNLVLFVGSALDGNDSVDQLQKFNQALIDHSTEKIPRTLDGIILTKFDTIDEKVGTTISLVYSSGLPIIFLGVGQHYNSLKQMNIQAVINALLK